MICAFYIRIPLLGFSYVTFFAHVVDIQEIQEKGIQHTSAYVTKAINNALRGNGQSSSNF